MHIRENIKSSVIITTLSKITSYPLFWILSFTILTAAAAQVTIPAKPVPFTLQTMMVLLAGAFLGAKNGAYSQLLYLGLGAIGLPVFAANPDGLYGIARLIGPTGGYLLAFPLAAFVAGYFIETYKNYFAVVLSMLLAEVIIIGIGVLYLDLFYIKSISESIMYGAAIFSVWSVIKLFAAATIFQAFSGIKKK